MKAGPRSALLAATVLLATLAPAAGAVPVTLPGDADQSSPQGEPSGDFVMHEEYFTTPDGTDLHAYVYRPAWVGDAPTPVQLIITPYANAAGHVLNPTNIDPLREPPGTYRGGGLGYFDRTFIEGYTAAIVSLPGLGGSSGCSDMGGPRQQAAARAAVEWARERPWSDGKVGVTGLSYPGLAALMTLVGIDDDYRGPDAVVFAKAPAGYGQIFENRVPLYLLGQAPHSWWINYGGSQFIPPSLVSDPAQHERHLQSLADGATCHPVNLAGNMDHNPDTDYWRERDIAALIAGVDVPVLGFHGFKDGLVSASQFFPVMEALEGPWRALIGPWEHSNRGGDRAEDTLIFPWLNHYLRGEPLEEAPRWMVQTVDGEWRAEQAWPPADAEDYRLPLLPGIYLDAHGNRSETSPPDILASYFPGQDLPGEYGRGTWTFSAPLTHDIHMAGFATLSVELETLVPGAHVIGLLYEVKPDGSAEFVTRGASVVPGPGAAQVSFDLRPEDWRFSEGSRIGLLVTGADDWWYGSGNTAQPVQLLGGALDLPLLRYDRAPVLLGPDAEIFRPYERAGEPFTVDHATIDGRTVAGDAPPRMQPFPDGDPDEREQTRLVWDGAMTHRPQGTTELAALLTRDADGTGVEGTIVTFEVEGRVHQAATDDAGRAAVAVPLSNGFDHEVTAVFPGDDDHLGSSATVVVVWSPGPPGGGPHDRGQGIAGTSELGSANSGAAMAPAGIPVPPTEAPTRLLAVALLAVAALALARVHIHQRAWRLQERHSRAAQEGTREAGKGVLMSQWKVVPAAMLLMLALAWPAVAQAPEYVSVPPILERAPADALYMEQRFTPVRTHEAVLYGQNWNVDGELVDLLLDVWEPGGHDEQFRPVIVWAPGSFNVNLGRSRMHWLQELVRRGYLLVPMEYRVRPDHPGGGDGLVGLIESLLDGDVGPVDGVQSFVDASHDAQHDMQAAVRWLRANAADLRIDPNRIIVGGYSAGGVTASRTVYNPDDPGDSGNPGWPSHVAAGIIGASGYGPGATGDVIRPGDPPTVWFKGTNDVETPAVASALPCANALVTANVCEYHLFPGAGHGLSAHDASIAFENADFLWRHVIDVDRIATELEGVRADGHGGTATVTGRLVTDDGAPLAGARVLGQATAGWAETSTADDGTFTLTVDAPNHGQSTDVLLRYEGHSTGSWLDDPQIAPTHTTATTTWGSGRAPVETPLADGVDHEVTAAFVGDARHLASSFPSLGSGPPDPGQGLAGTNGLGDAMTPAGSPASPTEVFTRLLAVALLALAVLALARARIRQQS